MPNLDASSRTLARMAERYMTDRCRITEATVTPTFNAETLEYDTPEPTVIYEGKCRVVPPSVGVGLRDPEFGETPLMLRVYTVYVPRDIDDVREGQVIELTASSDAALVGVDLLVKDFLMETHGTTRRIVAEFRHEDVEEEEGS